MHLDGDPAMDASLISSTIMLNQEPEISKHFLLYCDIPYQFCVAKLDFLKKYPSFQELNRFQCCDCTVDKHRIIVDFWFTVGLFPA